MLNLKTSIKVIQAQPSTSDVFALVDVAFKIAYSNKGLSDLLTISTSEWTAPPKMPWH